MPTVIRRDSNIPDWQIDYEYNRLMRWFDEKRSPLSLEMTHDGFILVCIRSRRNFLFDSRPSTAGYIKRQVGKIEIFIYHAHFTDLIDGLFGVCRSYEDRHGDSFPIEIREI